MCCSVVESRGLNALLSWLYVVFSDSDWMMRWIIFAFLVSSRSS